MIGTTKGYFLLIENSLELFHGKIPGGGNKATNDIVYCRSANCYFLESGNKILRKDLNGHDPYEFMPLGGNNINLKGNILLNSEVNQRLIVFQKYNHFSMINPLTKKRETTVDFGLRYDEHYDNCLIGEKEESFAILARAWKDACILLFDSKFRRRSKGCSYFGRLELELETSENEVPCSISCGPLGKYLFFSTNNNTSKFALRIFVLRVADGVVAAQTNHFGKLSIRMLSPLACYGYVGDHLIFLSLPRIRSETTFLYDFDVKNGEVKELKSKRTKYLGHSPVKIVRCGEHFYYTSDLGKVMRLKLVF